MSSDRAGVAREVLTELLEFANARAETVSDTKQFMRERYPSPPAPETVTVGAVNTLRTGTANTLAVTVDGVTWTQQHNRSWVPDSAVGSNRIKIGAYLDRIASDARVLAERDARIAELERQFEETARSRDGWQADAKREACNAEHWRTERDAAVRALEMATPHPIRYSSGSVGGDSTGTPYNTPMSPSSDRQHDVVGGHLDVAASSGEVADTVTPTPSKGDASCTPHSLPSPSPAPIPLGATVRHDDVVTVLEEAYGTNGFDINAAAMALAREVVALRHPVATRETVERVALDAWRDVGKAELRHVRQIVDHTYKAAGFTLETGDGAR